MPYCASRSGYIGLFISNLIHLQMDTTGLLNILAKKGARRRWGKEGTGPLAEHIHRLTCAPSVIREFHRTWRSRRTWWHVSGIRRGSSAMSTSRLRSRRWLPGLDPGQPGTMIKSQLFSLYHFLFFIYVSSSAHHLQASELDCTYYDKKKIITKSKGDNGVTHSFKNSWPRQNFDGMK